METAEENKTAGRESFVSRRDAVSSHAASALVIAAPEP
jgi:hypothetical protein